MTDHFARLDVNRQPWLDVEELKGRFHTLSQEVHPDRVHNASPAERETANAQYSSLNTAYNTLRQPKDRIAHLIELETGVRPRDIQGMSTDLADLFLKVGAVLKEIDPLVAQKESTVSPMLKVALMDRVMVASDRLETVQREVGGLVQALDQELKSMNTAWIHAPDLGQSGRREALPLARLEEMYRLLGYYTRWQQQLSDRLFRLSL
ncbi:MAG TPA: DnaJ domain-containing protein [Roseimicrobium sp.]|nr:DnaJ domain-containing protein [Roseimicrobium sp.]